MKKPELVEATQAQLDELLALAKTHFPQPQYELLKGLLATFAYVMPALQSAKTSLKRLRQMLFGDKTESKRNLRAKHPLATDNPSVLTPEATAAKDDHDEAQSVTQPPTPKAPAPGHGRNGASAYSASPVVKVELTDLKSGDPCPECDKGRVYASPPSVLIKMIGQSPIAATVYELSRLRCRLCDVMFTAVLPQGVAPTKHDHSCPSMLALLRYGSGMPFYRLEGLQANLNVPLPDATQWDIVSKAVDGPRAAFQELIVQAAQAPLLHNDDTPARILSLMAGRDKALKAGLTPVARAINTTGIVAVLPEHSVVLFFTGHAHAGNNLAKVLIHRAQGLDAPIQMCDALTCNMTEEFKTLLANCIAHGRRKFVQVMEHFPQQCSFVIEALGRVYGVDADCRKQDLTAQERLLHHQIHSGPEMQALQVWMNAHLDQRLAEPTSGLGQALRYFLKHWSALTLFLRKAGAPLDNNLCEQALKRSILHRKNSMFYKTAKGAEVGDIYMSLIHTCELCKVNAFEYLQALQAHVEKVQAGAHRWLPWNYREQLALSG